MPDLNAADIALRLADVADPDVAVALTPVVAGLVADARREERRQTLLEAAEAYPYRDAGGRTDAPGGARDWLRARAEADVSGQDDPTPGK